MVLLEIKNLTVNFYTADGVVTAVDSLSYEIEAGEKFGIVGESGAGKSVSALSLLQLIENPGRIEHGMIRYGQPEAIEEFEDEFPSSVIDLQELRQEHTLEAVAEDLEERDVDGSYLTGDPADFDADIRDLASEGKFDMTDVIGEGYAADLGLVGTNDFIVKDGADSYLELLRAPKRAVQRIRGNHIAMIFQDTVGDQIAEAMRHHLDYSDAEAKERTIELLDTVGIPDPAGRYGDYPHEFSGGMQQRVVIAMALSCNPDLLIADEPTTALDVMTEAKILGEIGSLAEEFGTAVELITHDLGVVAEFCDRVVVMYAGKPVEKAPINDLFYDPKHPYTVGLMTSIPRIGTGIDRLKTIPGTMPDLIDVPTGCSFHPRCPYAEDVCTEKEPALVVPDTAEVAGPDDERGSRCLAYTGDLSSELGYDVNVRDSGDAGNRGESHE
jgi:peptide/nickel transport system ATP-binding protein